MISSSTWRNFAIFALITSQVVLSGVLYTNKGFRRTQQESTNDKVNLNQLNTINKVSEKQSEISTNSNKNNNTESKIIKDNNYDETIQTSSNSLDNELMSKYETILQNQQHELNLPVNSYTLEKKNVSDKLLSLDEKPINSDINTKLSDSSGLLENILTSNVDNSNNLKLDNNEYDLQGENNNEFLVKKHNKREYNNYQDGFMDDEYYGQPDRRPYESSYDGSHRYDDYGRKKNFKRHYYPDEYYDEEYDRTGRQVYNKYKNDERIHEDVEYHDEKFNKYKGSKKNGNIRHKNTDEHRVMNNDEEIEDDLNEYTDDDDDEDDNNGDYNDNDNDSGGIDKILEEKEEVKRNSDNQKTSKKQKRKLSSDPELDDDGDENDDARDQTFEKFANFLDSIINQRLKELGVSDVSDMLSVNKTNATSANKTINNDKGDVEKHFDEEIYSNPSKEEWRKTRNSQNSGNDNIKYSLFSNEEEDLVNDKHAKNRRYKDIVKRYKEKSKQQQPFVVIKCNEKLETEWRDPANPDNLDDSDENYYVVNIDKRNSDYTKGIDSNVAIDNEDQSDIRKLKRRHVDSVSTSDENKSDLQNNDNLNVNDEVENNYNNYGYQSTNPKVDGIVTVNENIINQPNGAEVLSKQPTYDVFDNKKSEISSEFKLEDIFDNSDKIKTHIELVPNTIMLYVIDNFINDIVNENSQPNTPDGKISSIIKRDLQNLNDNEKHRRKISKRSLDSITDLESLISKYLLKSIQEIPNTLTEYEKELLCSNIYKDIVKKISNKNTLDVIKDKNDIIDFHQNNMNPLFENDYNDIDDDINNKIKRNVDNKYHFNDHTKPCINIKNLNIFYEFGEEGENSIHVPRDSNSIKLSNYEKRQSLPLLNYKNLIPKDILTDESLFKHEINLLSPEIKVPMKRDPGERFNIPIDNDSLKNNNENSTNSENKNNEMNTSTNIKNALEDNFGDESKKQIDSEPPPNELIDTEEKNTTKVDKISDDKKLSISNLPEYEVHENFDSLPRPARMSSDKLFVKESDSKSDKISTVENQKDSISFPNDNSIQVTNEKPSSDFIKFPIPVMFTKSKSDELNQSDDGSVVKLPDSVTTSSKNLNSDLKCENGSLCDAKSNDQTIVGNMTSSKNQTNDEITITKFFDDVEDELNAENKNDTKVNGSVKQDDKIKRQVSTDKKEFDKKQKPAETEDGIKIKKDGKKKVISNSKKDYYIKEKDGNNKETDLDKQKQKTEGGDEYYLDENGDYIYEYEYNNDDNDEIKEKSDGDNKSNEKVSTPVVGKISKQEKNNEDSEKEYTDDEEKSLKQKNQNESKTEKANKRIAQDNEEEKENDDKDKIGNSDTTNEEDKIKKVSQQSQKKPKSDSLMKEELNKSSTTQNRKPKSITSNKEEQNPETKNINENDYVKKTDVEKMIKETLETYAHHNNHTDEMFYNGPQNKYKELVKDIASYFAKKNVSSGDDVCIVEEYGSKHGDNDCIILSGTKLYQNGVPKKDAQNFNLIIKKPQHKSEEQQQQLEKDSSSFRLLDYNDSSENSIHNDIKGDTLLDSEEKDNLRTKHIRSVTRRKRNHKYKGYNEKSIQPETILYKNLDYLPR